MLEFFLAIPLFLLSVVITAGVLRMAKHAHFFAVPTDRSSHKNPTPVGGGVAIVFVYILGLWAVWSLNMVQGLESLALGVGVVVAIIGLADDKRHVDFRVRLLVQIAAVTGALALVGPLPHITMLGLNVENATLLFIFFSLTLLWMTNLYNFMDGIDGFAGLQACFVSLAAAGFLVSSHDYGLALLCIFVFAGAAGFLVWNWSPARIFMGDVGSGFLGFVLGLIAVISIAHGSMNLWSWVLLMGCFIADATWTLLRRVLSGERLYEAHCSHAFQIAAKRLDNHERVTIGLLLINALWLLPLAVLATKHPEYGVYFTAVGLLPLVGLALWLGAGKISP